MHLDLVNFVQEFKKKNSIYLSNASLSFSCASSFSTIELLSVSAIKTSGIEQEEEWMNENFT